IARTWAKRTPAGFEFSVKLYQKFTHPRLYRERVAGSLPDDVRAEGGLVEQLSEANAADVDEFRRGIEPLATAGKLGALLAQFPSSFKDDPASRDYLAHLLQSFAGYPVAVELRHRSWSDRFGDTLALLNGFQAGWVQI